jgi:hypothetical protein
VSRRRAVELADDEISFLRTCLEYLALRVRDHPADPDLAGVASAPGARELTMIAAIESTLADAQDIG